MRRAALTTIAIASAVHLVVGCGGTTTGAAVGLPSVPPSSSASPPSASPPSSTTAVEPDRTAGDVPSAPAPKGLTWYAGPVEGIEIAFPSDWYVVELTDPDWVADVRRQAATEDVDADVLVPALEAGLPGGALLTAVDMPAWRAGPGPLNVVGRQPARGASLDSIENDLRASLDGAGVEQLETQRATNDQGAELLHLTYGRPESNTFEAEFVALGSYSWAWTMSFIGPAGAQLPEQARWFDETAATAVIE